MVSGDGLGIEVDGTAAVPRVRFTGELDLAGVVAARAALADGVGESAERVELELGELAFLDSSGLSVFIELARRVPVTILSASGPVRRIITVTGLDETLGLAP
jgi:anti-sigma B factor antagonist